MRHFLSIRDLNSKEFRYLLKQTALIKKKPRQFSNALHQKTLLMVFEQPSVRTHLSFSVAMTQLGGHAIYYDIHQSTLGKKESILDYAHTVSRYANVISARLNDHSQLEELTPYSRIPVINAMTSLEHPCQALADFFTLFEKKKKNSRLKLAYVGDANNNVTNSLLYAAILLDVDMSIGCPKHRQLAPSNEIMENANILAMQTGSKSKFSVSYDPIETVQSADAVYTDSWMSYRVPETDLEWRENLLQPFQVNSELMQHAKKNAVFLHCLPAHRGHEVTNQVIDSKQSVVFDQAENRLHAQKALLLWLLNQK